MTLRPGKAIPVKLLNVVSEETWSAIRAACAVRDVDPCLLGRLVEARIRLSDASNRRSLFADFDRLLDDADAAALETPGIVDQPRTKGEVAAVQLRSLIVRNWKVFKHAELYCPPHDPQRPFVLIGGKNGSGKTSLLEALLFGLYGQWAPNELFHEANSSQTLRRRAYRKAVESAFHRRARSQGETVMGVTLSFDTSEGPLRIERRWYFGESGSFIEDDEEVILHTGENTDILAVPGGVAPNEFYQDEIARRLLPPALAPFFFFDGEQVTRLGERHLSEQIRLGGESLLGVPVLRNTANDLRDFARHRLRDAGAEKLETEDRRTREIAGLEGLEIKIRERLTALEKELSPLRTRRDALIAELGAIAGGTYADLQELLEQRKRNEGDQTRLRHAITSFAAEELPLVLAGPFLRRALIQRLRQEEASEIKSQFGSQHRDALDAFLHAFSVQAPPLEDDVEAKVVERIRAAWESWSRPGGPEEVRHHYLVGRSRAGVLDRLSQSDSQYEANAPPLIQELTRCVHEHEALTGLIGQHHGRSERRETLTAELNVLSAKLEAKDGERRQLDRELGEIRSALLPLREEDRLRRQRQEAGVPALRRGSLALRIAEGIEETIRTVVPTYLKVLAEKATWSFRALAHKELIEGIEIGPDGEVTLIDRASRPVQDLDASAGERHIFAMALMAAVAELAGCALPIVMDTPLGRLDSEHREFVLRFFSTRGNQIILLSHPNEIDDRYYAQIESRIMISYHLDHETGIDGPGESLLNEGYFSQVTA